MGGLHNHTFNININPPPATTTQISVGLSPMALLMHGLNIPVEVTTASAFRQQPNPEALRTVLVMAHFDTGASVTSIDVDLARHLNLIPTGLTPSMTAAGRQIMPTYAIDLSFPNSTLQAFSNLQIGSCRLNYNVQGPTNDPRNFGLLLGRDVMSKWNIFWHGPTSSVFISD